MRVELERFQEDIQLACPQGRVDHVILFHQRGSLECSFDVAMVRILPANPRRNRLYSPRIPFSSPCESRSTDDEDIPLAASHPAQNVQPWDHIDSASKDHITPALSGYLGNDTLLDNASFVEYDTHVSSAPLPYTPLSSQFSLFQSSGTLT